ncbi:NADH-quinone oxidoreductase subunit NuoE [Leptospira santarosai]|uniref:NADH-quinone oxidoreductase subunit NuoE n=1 Tax=Leptospira santarosai TaxID=28183 RepID=UPI0002BFD447|nr:NADH-quinone oxidoreductase subunit NuoE [Leptospira santarosai]AVV51855.1 NADH-quinone oxidoreductase, E subunit [Leptospira santarosai]EMM87580.1 NADH-quinone oxidoreductase, E subunit [Leptospira santarosai str. 2000027870]MDI7164712.1 NADH-quinone oxidoreductase subunit NuoE [Leptospira santarosai]MDI7195276.1 NADH-quinone oxidoreductase subunit NuoE [Leptospira santarosai]MDI7229562.1 NADH-quinone oxidoreductase subunit NuoE [Leptospira santarosai]
MGYRFSEASEKRFQKMLEVFPEKRSLILPCLYILQRENGFVDQAGMDYIATRLGDPISLAQVYGVATFYTLYNKKPVGKYHIQICGTSSCYLQGNDRIEKQLCDRLGIHLGQTTPDQKFTLEEVECLGACGYAPMVQINDDFYEQLTPEKVDQILSGLN